MVSERNNGRRERNRNQPLKLKRSGNIVFPPNTGVLRQSKRKVGTSQRAWVLVFFWYLKSTGLCHEYRDKGNQLELESSAIRCCPERHRDASGPLAASFFTCVAEGYCEISWDKTRGGLCLVEGVGPLT